MVRKTRSVCPVCMKKISAAVFLRGEDYFMEKTCPEHGFFKTIVWRGTEPSYEAWGAGYKPKVELRVKGAKPQRPDCINDCGLCSSHLQKTCCALVEVTRGCNMSCPVCFAESRSVSFEPDVETLRGEFERLVSGGNTFVQLSGGEPTVRDDLPEIIAAARDAGCTSIQLNTNGIRLAVERGYAQTLADAGLSFVFMQFDGTSDDIYEKLRGTPLFAVKCRAIENCDDANLGVTLVPTVVMGVNLDNIGGIIDFALKNSPAVRGVHFQPISYFGRYPALSEDRVTLPDVLRAIETQTDGKFKLADFLPSRCDHPYCGFHGDFAVLPNKAVMKLTPKNPAPCCSDDGDEHIKNRAFVSRRWKRSASDSGACCEPETDFTDMSAFLKRVKSHGFTITAMAFQDAMNLDIERLRRCSLHVAENGKLIPFCAKYITPIKDGAK